MCSLILQVFLLCSIFLCCCGNTIGSHHWTESVKCNPSWFECNNRICINPSLKCNGVDECGDNSDEDNCLTYNIVTRCPSDAYLCKNPRKCVPLDDLCSDFNECNDYDEIDKLCPIICQPQKFKCLNTSQCVSKKYLCDGNKDCADESDELNCDDDIYKCREDSTSFLCEDHSACLHGEFACDGEEMCDDGSDEKNECYKQCQAKKCGPDQLCLPDGRGVQCVCKDGYRFDEDKKTCVDKEFCNVSDLDRPCSQKCVEGQTRAQCRCIHGYTLNKDGKTCSAIGSEAILYISNASGIYQWTLESQKFTSLITDLPGVRGLAIDSTERRIFWSESGSGQPEILSLSLSDKRTKIVVASFGLQKPESLAFDFITKNLYVIDSGIPAILACEPEQRLCVTVFNNTVVTSPKDIAVHPAKGLLYYTETGKDACIMRGSMDGSSHEVFVHTSILHPVSLFIDLTTNRLYWIDASLERVYNVDLDGTQHRPVLFHKISSPSMISIFEDSVFWANQGTNDVISANKFTGGNTRTIVQDIMRPTAIVMEHKSLQDGHMINPCNSKKCHLCLLNDQGTASCFCSPGYQMDSTWDYCERLKPHSFLLASNENQIVRVNINNTGRLTPSYIRTRSMNRLNALAYLSSHEVVYSDLNIHSNSTKEAFISKVQGMDGRAQSVMVTKDLSSVQSIVVEESSSLVFWTDAAEKAIYVASLDGSYKVKLPLAVTSPCGLSIEPVQGLLYYSELKTYKYPAVIGRCWINGQSCSSLVSNRLVYPSYLLAHGQHLYWSDSDLGEISSIDQWGSDRTTIITTDGKPTSFAIDQNVIYWTEEGKNILFYKNIHADGLRGQLEIQGGSLTGLVVAVPHSLTTSACSYRNGGCEHLCLSIKRSVEVWCMCTQGFHLHPDGKQCIKSDPTECVWFLCKSENRCLTGGQTCDGINDCMDGSDEDNCPHVSTCFKEDFHCDNGQCISNDFTCDGQSDCKDGSDEKLELCPNTCYSSHHICDKYNCIPDIFLCDEDQDCEDGSDEINCPVCEKDKFICGDNHCIPDDWVCDGSEDCSDGKDEIGCKVKDCDNGEFKCMEGKCIDESEVCDEVENCDKGEDEDGCVQPPKCLQNEFKCYDEKCILKSAQCNGVPDCTSHEDEDGCDNLCSTEQFQCQDRACISFDQKCDKMIDCEDGSDEGDFCLYFEAETKQGEICEGFVCATGQCIDFDQRCDGKTDCRDYSDETNCKVTCKNFNSCGQICMDTPTGVSCRCRQGYHLMDDGLACEDIDECLDQNGGCSHKCVNLKGTEQGLGFKCQCHDGFQRGKDHFSCKVTSKRPVLYVSTNTGIKKFAVDGVQRESMVVTTQTRAVKMVVDEQTGSVYWAEFEAGGWTKMNLWQKMGEKKSVIFTGKVIDLAIDPMTSNMYLLLEKKISVLSSDGFLSTLLTVPISLQLVVHPKKGFMFWISTQPRPNLMKASMDGSDQKIMRQASRHMSFKFTSLSLDHTTERLYWVNEMTGQLKSVTINDENIYTYDLRTNAYQIISMDVFEGIIYFTSWDNSVQAFPTYGYARSGVTVIKKMHDPNVLQVHHPLKQSLGRNMCAIKECMYMCVTSHSGAHCLCPDNKKNEDNPQCLGPKTKLSISPVPPPFTKKQPAEDSVTMTSQRANNTLRFSPVCPDCLNGGVCTHLEGKLFCRCPNEFDGPLCEKRRDETEKRGATDEESHAWLAALILGFIVLFGVIGGVWFFKFRRNSHRLNTIRFKKQKKFVVCNQGDKEDLVPEISFGNPGFQDEIDEEADMREDHEWWKKLIARSRRSVDSAFHSKNSSERSIVDDGIDGFMRGDPQDPAMSDKVRLLK